nr:unnamed protein product [Gossypium raimondii]
MAFDGGVGFKLFMDSQADLSLEIRKTKLSGLQKREALEKEVSMLQNMLNQEEKMHEILTQFQLQEDGSSISIPDFLPPKMKELLTELAMVESEIAHLETQISQLKHGLNQEHEVIITKGKTPSKQKNPIMQDQQENVVFETKALHFISKAMKGDYTLSDFMSLNETMGNSGALFQEKIPKKSGYFKTRESIVEANLDLPPKSPSSALIVEKNSQNWHPNKLSENIMKCLHFIFVRLLRTSRAMELEKSSNVTRSMNTPLSSRSFRVENTLNPKSNPQKKLRQQDPYGIFNMEGSIPRDIGPYKNLAMFTSSSMDPNCISTSSSIPLLKKLRVLMSNLQKVDLRVLTYQQKLAFWINMYNACIMHGYLQYGLPDTSEGLLAMTNKATLDVGGNKISAQAMEHHILGKQSTGLKIQEVRIYTGDGVSAELEKSKQEYLQASIMVSNTKKIAFPELLLNNMFDFAVDMNSLVQWVCQQLPTSGSLRKSMVDCYRNHNAGKTSSSISVEKIPYDFEFQYLLAM